MNERSIEIPFLLRWMRGPRILDVGVDQVGYTDEIKRRIPGVEILGCDPAAGCYFQMRFEDLPEKNHYDTVLFISSLEHFAPVEDNRKESMVDILCIKKALRILNPKGRVILTVPYGKSQCFANSFIQYDQEAVERIIAGVGIDPVVSMIYRFDQNRYGVVVDAPDADYVFYDSGQGFAPAVWASVWENKED